MNTKLDRRRLLQLAAGSVVLPFVSTVVGAKTSVDGASSRNGKRVILIELSGANDGLNTLVPYSDDRYYDCLLYTSPSPRDRTRSRMPSSA